MKSTILKLKMLVVDEKLAEKLEGLSEVKNWFEIINDRSHDNLNVNGIGRN